MPQLWLTFIDVGWGDSILLELEDGSPTHRFALIDSNDTTAWPSTRSFLKRHFERYAATLGNSTALPYPLFDFVVATHAHTDHISGLRWIINRYGADRFYFPRFDVANSAAFDRLLSWASSHINSYNNLPVTNQRKFLAFPDTFTFGSPQRGVQCGVLWPPPPQAGFPNDPNDPNNENNNSVVLSIQLNDVVFVTTGDCEVDNWKRSSGGGTWKIGLPNRNLKLVQIPHHGAQNGLLDAHNNAPMLDQIHDLQIVDPSVAPMLVASCHPKPHHHPAPAVAQLLDSNRFGGRFTTCIPGTNWLRTDKNLHFTVWTDGTTVETRARPPF